MKEPDHLYIAGLVLRAQQNDNDAFAEIYALTYNKVYNYCRHYLRNDFSAQDAMQEVYISALRNIQKINDPTLFIAWLNRISFNVCYDMTRKNNSQDDISNPEIMDILHDDYLDSNPEALAQKKDEVRLIRQAVEALPFNQQEVITMRYFNNMKINEIADALGISKSSVKRYIAVGLDELRIILKEWEVSHVS